jgi:SAM-dependent methyltransferase
MALFQSMVRSTVRVSRRAMGLPLVLERLAHVEGKLDRVTSELARLDEFARMDSACSYEAIMGHPRAPTEKPARLPLGSGLCRQGDFALDAYRYWIHALQEAPRFHRKQWEYFFISQALHERGKLAPGCRGLGFGVGQESLPALFASLGCDVLATDQEAEGAERAGWAQTGQHTTGAPVFNRRGVCDDAQFRRRVAFRCVDMNAIPGDLSAQFDFCWSTCSLEHLGSLEHGMRFVENSIATLKPGGVAVHTTEFNLSSNSDTIESRDLSVYRRRDIETLIGRLDAIGCRVEPVEWEPQTGFVDNYVDLPPYKRAPHLRLRLGAYDCTSIGLILVKG